MTLSELISAFRIRADDMISPYLWSDPEVTLYLNEADNEAAGRAELIQDDATAAVCTLTMVAATAKYALHASVLRIERAKLTSTGKFLKVVARETLDADWPLWEAATGTPQYLVDGQDGFVTVAPTPIAVDTIQLTVKRLPLTVMALPADTPEIPARYHYRMIDWALRCAYLKHDADAWDKEASDRNDAAFTISFGRWRDANVQRKQRDKRRPFVRMGW
jgi:hypothetical protein